MAITPIDITGFTRNPMGIEAVLSRGASALQGVIQNALQTGRDQANNQARQERAFLDEQRREINLRQRRGEVAQQDFEDNRNFVEGQRRFDATFGENTRQFDTRMVESGLDRGLQAAGLAVRAKQGDAQIDISKEQLGLSKQRLDNETEDLQFRREDRKQDRDVAAVRLESAKLALASAKSEEERAKAKAEYDGSLRDAQSIVLTSMDTLLEAGKMDEAKSFFTTHIENPAYEFPDNTRSRLARRVDIDLERSPGTGSTGQDEVPVEDLTPEQIDAELAIRENATSYRSDKESATSEKNAMRRAALLQRKAELDSQTPTGRMSEAERLKQLGRSNRR